MKKLLLLCLLLSGLSAQECNYSRIFAGGQGYYYHLRIHNVEGLPAAETPYPFTGWLGGFVLGYEYKQPKSLYAMMQISYALGTIETTPGSTGNIKRFIHDEIVDARLGYSAALDRSQSWLFTPYTGAGFRWNIQYRNPGTLGELKFNYYKIYIPLGALLNYCPNSTLDLGVDFEWMPDVLSMISLSEMEGAFWELTRMNNYQVQLPCIFHLTPRWELSLVPFWYHFWDGESTAVTSTGLRLNLQKQMTNDWGLRANLGVDF